MTTRVPCGARRAGWITELLASPPLFPASRLSLSLLLSIVKEQAHDWHRYYPKGEEAGQARKRKAGWLAGRRAGRQAGGMAWHGRQLRVPAVVFKAADCGLSAYEMSYNYDALWIFALFRFPE